MHTPKTLTIRAPGPADCEALARLGTQTFVETFGALYSSENLTRFLAQSHSPTAVARHMARQGVAYRLAEEQGTPAGYCRIGPVDLPVDIPGRKAMELAQLYVLAPWQGSGLAAELMDWALAEFARADCDDAYLSVYRDNVRAQRFYARYGFAWHADYTFKVGDHIDPEFILRKRLRP